MITPAQDANNERVQKRFNVQGLVADEESVFKLTSAPPLQKHIKTSDIFMEVQHFVPTRFEDKMKFMIMIETNRKKFLAERKRAKELIALGLASAELKQNMFGKKRNAPETMEQQEKRRIAEGIAAQEENRLFALYELHEDRKLYYKTFQDKYESNQIYKAHHYAKKYLDKCSEDQMEIALRQNVIALRRMGKSIGKRGRDCEMKVEEARGNSYNVLKPKIIPDNTERLTKNISPLSPPSKKCIKNVKVGSKNKNGIININSRERRLQKIKKKKSKRQLKQRNETLALNRRRVMNSVRKLPPMILNSGEIE